MKCSYCFVPSFLQGEERGQVIVFERSHGVGYFAPSTPNHFEHTGTSLFHWLTSDSSAVATDSPTERCCLPRIPIDVPNVNLQIEFRSNEYSVVPDNGL
ncbi:hypothetical protein TNCT_604991 [Trichonephila clavata]|uniref:Uncharacterized protein n=1 Tax=Trichonephila clavata TaxID=2740835 RepID=A0A8X6GGC6_TRICU|nr:hypothetical protein TNCT_604991 [Trichonephila clavata]